MDTLLEKWNTQPDKIGEISFRALPVCFIIPIWKVWLSSGPWKQAGVRCYWVLSCWKALKEPNSLSRRKVGGGGVSSVALKAIPGDIWPGQSSSKWNVVLVNTATGESFFLAFVRVCPSNRIRKPAKGLGTHCHKQSSDPVNAGRRLQLPFQT